MVESDVRAYLPYGPDFSFVDRVLSHTEVGDFVTEKTFHTTHPILLSHFARGPSIVPGVILVEMANQSALLLATLSGRVPAHARMLLGSIKASFLHPVPAGSVVTSQVTIDSPAGGFEFKAVLSCQGKTVARVQGIGVITTDSIQESGTAG